MRRPQWFKFCSSLFKRLLRPRNYISHAAPPSASDPAIVSSPAYIKGTIRVSLARALADLPTELRQMIYKHAASNNNSAEIRVTFADQTSTKLQAPAVDFFLQLQQLSPILYQDAVPYLTSPLFYWNFVSETEPHRLLLQVFRQKAPEEVIACIIHVRIYPFTIRPYQMQVEIPKRLSRRQLLHLHPYARSTRVTHQACRNASDTLSLVARVFCSLRSLEITLDATEGLEECRLCGRNMAKRDELGIRLDGIRDVNKAMMRVFACLNAALDPGQISLHIFWEEVAHMDIVRVSKKGREVLQYYLAQDLRRVLMVKHVYHYLPL